MVTFVRSHFSSILAAAIIVAYGLFVFSQLTTYPRLWLDEGFKMQLARNFSETGIMGIQFNPGVMEYSVHNASTGWPVVLALGSFFKIFGVSFGTGRIFSSLFLMNFVIVAYLLVKKYWGRTPALLSLLLLVTYAPLYVNGKMILAEGMGFFWLALGFLLAARNKHVGWAGIAFGLFAGSKFAFAATFLPALFIGLVLATYWKQIKWREALSCLGMALLTALPTIYMTLVADLGPQILANPYGQTSLIGGVFANLKLFLSSSTLWHMLVLLAVASCAVANLWKRRSRDWRVVTLIFYGLAVIAYWLLSPGVFRYLLPLIVILLTVTPNTLSHILGTRYPNMATVLVLMLVLIQGYHFTTRASISHGSDYLRLEQYLEEHPIESDMSVGIINSSFVPVLVPITNITQFFRIDAIEEGENPLAVGTSSLLDVIIHENDNYERDVRPYLYRLNELYDASYKTDKINIWTKK